MKKKKKFVDHNVQKITETYLKIGTFSNDDKLLDKREERIVFGKEIILRHRERELGTFKRVKTIVH